MAIMAIIQFVVTFILAAFKATDRLPHVSWVLVFTAYWLPVVCKIILNFISGVFDNR